MPRTQQEALSGEAEDTNSKWFEGFDVVEKVEHLPSIQKWPQVFLSHKHTPVENLSFKNLSNMLTHRP